MPNTSIQRSSNSHKRKYAPKDPFNYQDAATPKFVDLQITNVFMRNMEATAKEIVNRGSSGSSKSHSIGQLMWYKMLTEKEKKILIVRKSLPFLRISTLVLMRSLADQFGITPEIKEEKVGLNMYYDKSWMHFGSVDDPQKIKSTEWNYIWMEEATEFTYEDYQLVRLYNRAKSVDNLPNQMFLSFNPIDERHWIKKEVLDKVQDKKQVIEIHSTYKDNPFLPKESVERIEALQEQDYNYYRVMGLGEWGKLENLIYSNWRSIHQNDLGEGEIVYGLDFGYNVESALIKCIIDKDNKDTIYEEQLIYKKKLTNSDLIAQMKKVIPREHWRTKPIYADPAEPDRIKEIYDAGFQRVKGANKNILDGIDFVKRLKIYISENSSDIIKEKTAYCWKKDRMTEEIIDEPVDYNNHLMDAERYAIFSHLRGVRDYKVRWL
jgi:phage terminase large subunit